MIEGLRLSFGFWLALCLWAGTGCAKHDAPPPLTVAEVPAAMEKAFEKAKPDVKQVAQQALASLKQKDYPRAHGEFQGLCAVPELTKAQRDVATRAMLAVNEQLQAAQAQGDAQAQEVLRFNSKYK